MSISGFSVKTSQGNGEYANEVLPEDSYQVMIDKVELREGTKYMSQETEMQLLFYLKPTEVDEKFKNKILFYQTSTSFFNGESKNAKKKVSPSKLYLLIKTIYKTYKPDVDVSKMKPEDVTDDVINELEGKQLVAIVKINENGNNRVSEILPAKNVSKTSKEKEDDFIHGLEKDMQNELS